MSFNSIVHVMAEGLSLPKLFHFLYSSVSLPLFDFSFSVSFFVLHLSRFLPSILTAVLSHHIGWVASAKDGSLQQSLTDSKLKYGSSGGCGGQNTNCNGNAGSSNDAASPGSGLADCLQIQMR